VLPLNAAGPTPTHGPVSVVSYPGMLQSESIEHSRLTLRVQVPGYQFGNVITAGTAIQNFVAHYHGERNHQGLANQLISPEPGHLVNAGEVQRRQRLGSMLNYYYRAAA
jgi:hypothetical protein